VKFIVKVHPGVGWSRNWKLNTFTKEIEEACHIENLPQEGIVLKVFLSFTSAGQSQVHVT